MEPSRASEGPASGAVGSVRRRNAVAFCCVAVAWLLLDQLTKLWAEAGPLAAGGSGASAALPLVDGVVRLMLVHNTGGAWGLFGDMTLPLAVVSLVVCAAAVAYLFVLAPDSPLGAAVGLALVFAGGVGNALDRIFRGYVVDFIDPTFIDFPVFNVADIGVTCGIVLFIAALAVQGRAAA